MLYNFKGKNIKIPDDIIQKSMKALDLSQEEAIQMYLEDEGLLENEEQEALNQKAKKNRITATIHEASAVDKTKKTQKERTQKEDVTKEKIIAEIAETIRKFGENVEIVNKSKLITFKLGDDTFKLDLIRQRKPKK